MMPQLEVGTCEEYVYFNFALDCKSESIITQCHVVEFTKFTRGSNMSVHR